MNLNLKNLTNGLLAAAIILLLSACAPQPQSIESGGTAWGTGTFHSNGERIYFTATSERGTPITSTSGPGSNCLMIGGGGRMTCASCHGIDGRGGVHNMGMMQSMTAPDIRWSTLQADFDAEKFRLAVTKGQDPDGTQMNADMPHWAIGNEDLADLIAYLKTLP